MRALLISILCRCLACTRSRSGRTPRQTTTLHATFSTSTQLVIETVVVKDKTAIPSRPDRQGLHGHRRRRAADDPLLRISEAAD